MTCSDPAFRAEYADVLAAAKPVPPQNAVDMAILATGKTSEQIAQQLGRAMGIDGPEQGAKTALEGWVVRIATAAEAAERTLTVVVDALDEAADPGAVLTTLLARVNSPERQRMRLLVGVRSSGGPDVPEEAARDLASVATMALGARQIRVDEGEFWEPHDLPGYVEQLLRQPGSPYQDRDPASGGRRGGAVWRARTWSRRLTARALAGLDEPLAASDPRLGALLAKPPRSLWAGTCHVGARGRGPPPRGPHAARVRLGRGAGSPGPHDLAPARERHRR